MLDTGIVKANGVVSSYYYLSLRGEFGLILRGMGFHSMLKRIIMIMIMEMIEIMVMVRMIVVMIMIIIVIIMIIIIPMTIKAEL